MPEIVHGPELTAVNTGLTASQTAALLSLFAALPGPADRPALGRLIRAAAASCSAAVARLQVIAPEVQLLEDALQAASAAMHGMPSTEGAALMRGQTTRFPAWNCFVLLAPTSPPEVLLLAGAELLNAIFLRRPFRRGIAAQIAELLFREVVEDRQKALSSMNVLAGKLLRDIATYGSATKQGDRLLLLAERVKTSLAAQLNAPSLDDRKGCGSARELSASEMSESADILLRRVREGDGVALAIVIAFCCGPTWDTVVEFPLENHADDEWVARIDAGAGVVQIDLTTLLELAAPKPGHQPASAVLVIPLPEFAADALRTAVASQPTARCLKELVCLDGITSRTVLPGMPKDAPIPVTIARFIRTRATVAIRAGVDRGLAAYGCGDLAKVSKSSHSYWTGTLLEIWDCNTRRYAAIGWGAPVIHRRTGMTSVGSMATPTDETVRHIDKIFVNAANTSRAGKRYTWDSLIRAHNPYARLCAHRAGFFTAARGAAQFRFYADMLDEACAAAGLVDKRVGPFHGSTPIPMPVRLAIQLQWWKEHLRCLQRRITRIQRIGSERIVRRIEQILDGEHVPLFFLLRDDGAIAEFGSEELLEHHRDIPAKADWQRHYVNNALRSEGVPFTCAGAQLRHHIEGLSPSDLSFEVPMLVVMEQLAHGLDRIAVKLGMHPVAGLSRGKDVRHGYAG